MIGFWAMPSNDRYPRWQKIFIDQFGYAINLILTFAIATLGYCFALLKDRDFAPGCPGKSAMLLSIVALGVSAISGGSCVINRLWDFRGTAQRAHNDVGAPSQEKLRRMGEVTWTLFYIQILAFLVGVAALAVTFLSTYGHKLA
jgi:hypothetical protein